MSFLSSCSRPSPRPRPSGSAPGSRLPAPTRRFHPCLLAAIGFLAAAVPSLAPAADGPGLGSSTFPAGTLIRTIDGFGGRAVMWHRGWLYVVGNGTYRSAVWDISNPSNPVKRGEAPGSNCHDYIRYGDLMWRDYSLSEIGASHGLIDLNQLPNFVRYTGAAIKPGFKLDYYGFQWGYPYVDQLNGHNYRGTAGISADSKVIIGNLLILYPINGNDQSGLATFDISDPASPRLLDVERNAAHQYTTGHHVWKHHFFQIGEQNNIAGGTYNFVGWDFSNPSDLRISHTVADWPGRYACFQDEFAFNGTWSGVWKYNLETKTRVLNIPAPANASDFYWLPIGHLLVGSGDSGKTWIYSHQDGLDTRRPYVNWHYPRPNAVNQNVRSRVGLVINETYDSRTVNESTVILRNVSNGQNVNSLVSHSDTGIINIGPVSPLAANTTYEVILTANGIRDAAGNGINEFRYRFSTGPTVQGGTTTGSSGTTGSATTGSGTTGSATTGGSSTGGSSTGGGSTGGSSTGGSSTGGTTGQPDLIVTDVTWNPASPNPGQDVTFSAVIRNQGTAASPAGTVIGVGFLVNGTSVGWGIDDSSGLAAGATRTIVGTGAGAWNAVAGTHTVEGFVDDVNRIAESNETNNRRAEDLTVASVGQGIGLRGEYFANRTLSGTPALVRTDATVDFSWGTGSPGAGIGVDQFSVRWTGELETPISGSFVFQTESDDGVRLWVNNTLVIDNWTDHATTVNNSSPVTLAGNTKYPVRMEYYESGGGAVARLRWQLPGGASAIAVPQDRLYPASGTTTGGGTTSGATTGSATTGGTTGGTPSVSLTMTPSSPLSTGTQISLTLTAANLGSGLQYHWEFGDGTVLDWSASNGSVTKTFSAPGNYSIVGQVRNGAGDVLSATRPVLMFAAGAQPTTQSTPILVDAGRRTVWVANPDADTVTVLNADTLAKVAEIAVDANPMSLALDGSGQIWVACRDDDSLVVINAQTRAIVEVLQLSHGAAPVGVVCNPAGNTVYVAEYGKGRIQRFTASTRANSGTLSIGPTPRALAMTSDGGRLLVTRFISSNAGATVWSVNTATFSSATAVTIAPDTATVDNSNAARGVQNYLAGIAVHPGNGTASVVSKKDNIFRGTFRDGQALTFETSVRSVMSTLNLGNNTETVGARIDFDNTSQPSAVTASPQGNHLFVTIQGNNELLVLDAFNRGGLARVTTGLAPQGVAVDPTTRRVFVQNFMARTVSVFNGAAILTTGAGEFPLVSTVTTVATEKLSPQVLLGKQIFYNAVDPRMSKDAYISCAVCHLDGDHDGRTWDFTDRGEGLRNTISLRGQEGHLRGPVHWTGNFDEIQDFEHDIRNAFGGTGFLTDAQFNTGTRNTPLGAAKAGVSADLDALAAYVNSLNQSKRSPARTPDGALTADAQAGQALFQQLSCAQCHSGSDFSDSALNVRHNVGTIKASSGKRLGQTLDGFDTPSLVALWNTAPYLHDGSAATVRDVLTTANTSALHGNLSALSSAQIDQLAAFLLQIETGTPNPGVGTTTGGGTSGGTSGGSTLLYNGESGGRTLATGLYWSYPNNRPGGNGLAVSESAAGARTGANGLVLDAAWNFSVAGAYGVSFGYNWANWQAAGAVAADPATGSLSLWIRGSRAYATESLRIRLRDVADGQTDEIALSQAHLAGGVTTGWKQVQVPLTAFTPAAGFNWNQLAELDITVIADPWGQAGSLILHVDDITIGSGAAPAAWSAQDVGSVGVAGTFVQSGGTFTLEGSGSDIWAAADGFRYATLDSGLNGDGEIRARLVSVENTDPWAKAGVMIRGDLTAGSPHAFMALTSANGVAFQRRTVAGGTSDHTGTAGTAPRWLRLVRSGNVLTGYHSADGATWTQVGTATVTMGSSVRVGLAVTSHNNTTLCTAVFDNVAVTD